MNSTGGYQNKAYINDKISSISIQKCGIVNVTDKPSSSKILKNKVSGLVPSPGITQSGSQHRKNLIIAVVIIVFIVIVISAVVWYFARSVDGSYSQWSNFGPCSLTCGGGTRKRTRLCNNPAPKRGGKNCEGPSIEIDYCANSLCPGSAGISKTQQLVQDILLDFHAKSNPTKPPSGKFQKAIFAMQREVANEFAFEEFSTPKSRSRRAVDSSGKTDGGSKTASDRLDNMKKIIKIAITKSSKDFARTVFAKSLYVFIKKEISEGTAMSKISKAANGYLESIKKDIGEQAFSELILENGGATLMFVIDTTGSMTQEIKAAKAIATAIINKKRDFPVDYILSPFNDPGTGPVTYMREQEKDKFVSAIDNLRARGGGDCPELAFKGMLNALTPEPQLGSPMFVFTDASAKDDTYSMMNKLMTYSEYFASTINFFAKSKGCGSGIDSFSEIAAHTSGQIFPLKSDAEIANFTDYVETSLNDSVIVSEGKNGRSFFITLDGEVKFLVIALTVKVDGTAKFVKLVDPSGVVRVPKLVSAYSCIHQIPNPMSGRWHLKFPISTRDNSFVAKSVGNNAVDFMPYFLHREREGDDAPVLSIGNPVKGNNSTTMLQIAGSNLLDHTSLLLDVLGALGNAIQMDVKLETMPGAKGILKGLIKTPIGKFKVALKGKKTDGQNFTRVSQTSFQASNIVMLAINAGVEFTANVTNSTVPIRVYFFSNAAKDTFILTASSTFGSVAVNPNRFELLKGRNATIGLTHNLPFNAASLVGKIVTITLSAIGQYTKEKNQLEIKMLYVN